MRKSRIKSLPSSPKSQNQFRHRWNQNRNRNQQPSQLPNQHLKRTSPYPKCPFLIPMRTNESRQEKRHLRQKHLLRPSFRGHQLAKSLLLVQKTLPSTALVIHPGAPLAHRHLARFQFALSEGSWSLMLTGKILILTGKG